jgi:hypothetical protein
VGVFVVGMHRSGTSAVAAALEAFGLDVGAPDRLMAADAGNPAGYYELHEIGDLNDEMLEWRGGRWDSPPETPDRWELTPEITPYYRRAAAIVSARLARNRWLIKDPRITLLLPLWRRAVLDRCAAVLIVRSPMEVAWSLALRNGMPIVTGLALWSEYNRAALRGLSGLPVYVCQYDELVTDPHGTLGAIASSLDSWHELPEGADVEAAAARVRPELRRNTWPRDTPDALDIPIEIERFAKSLKDLVGPHESFEPGHFPAAPWERALLGERRTGLARLRVSTRETEAAEGQRDEVARERDNVARERDEAARVRDENARERDEAARERDEAARGLDGTARERDELGARLESVQRDLAAARQQAAEVPDLRAQVSSARGQNGQLEHNLERVHARLTEVESDLQDVQARRRDAERLLRQSEARSTQLERRFPIRVARLLHRCTRALLRRR